MANLFFSAVRRGASTPAAVVHAVQVEIQRRLQWSTKLDGRQWWVQVLNILANDPQDAQTYATTVLAREKLPPEAKARLKQERAQEFVLAAMRGRPVTEKQLALLRTKGYEGPPPADRAAASELIDRLLTGKGVV